MRDNLVIDTLIFIANRKQFDSFTRSKVQDTDYVVASMDYDVTLELKSKHIRVIDLFKYLDGQVTERIWADANSWCEAFANAFHGKLLYRGCDIVNMTQGDLEYPFLNYLTANHVVSKALEEFYPNQVVHFAEMSQISFADEPDPCPDIFNAVVAHCAHARDIKTFTMNVSVKSAENDTRQTIALNSKKEPAPYFKLVSEKCPVLSLVGNYREQELFLEEAVRQNRKDLVLITAEPAGKLPWLSMYTAYALRFDIGMYKKKWRHILFENHLALCHHAMRHGEALKSQWFAFFWERYLDQIILCARFYALGIFVSNTLSPKLLITSYDWFGSIRCLQKAAKENDINILSVDHVGMGEYYSHWRNRNAFAHVLVWGEHDCKEHLKWRDKNAQVLIIGSLRKDHAELNMTQTADTLCSNDTDLGELTSPRIVLFTTRLTFLHGTSIDSSAYEESWRQLIALCARHSDWDIIVKPHPNYDYYSFYRSFSSFCPHNLRVVHGRPKDVLHGATVAVFHNCSSTAALDAMGMSVPVVYLKDAILNEWPLSPFENNDSILVAASVIELEAKITPLLAKNGYRETVLNRQKEFFNRIIAAKGDKAVAKMNCAIEKLVSYEKTESFHEDGLALLNLVLIIDAIRFAKLDWLDCRRLLEEVCPKLPTSNPNNFGFTCFADLGEEMLVSILYSLTVKYSLLNLYKFLGIFRIIPKEYRPAVSNIRNVMARGCFYLQMSHKRNPLLRASLNALLYLLDKEGSLIDVPAWR